MATSLAIFHAGFPRWKMATLSSHYPLTIQTSQPRRFMTSVPVGIIPPTSLELAGWGAPLKGAPRTSRTAGEAPNDPTLSASPSPTETVRQVEQ